MNNSWPDHQIFWKQHQVCVTGGSGFLGSYVVEKLKERGATDIVVPRSKNYNLCDVQAIRALMHNEMGLYYGNPSSVIVIHLAARVGGIGINRERPADFFYQNLMMGTQLLHESWRFGVRKFVAIGTAGSYPRLAPLPFKEENLWDGYPEEINAPFGLAQKMLLVQSQAYRRQYGFNAIYLLPANLYGPGDNFDLETSSVIPALIRKCLEAQQGNKSHIVAWGDGSATREFLYVEDAAEAIVLAAERYNKSEPVNLGSGVETSIKDLTEMIAHQTGYKGPVNWDTTKPNGQPRCRLDTRRAEEEFGFKAKTSLDVGLQKTIDWYHQNYVMDSYQIAWPTFQALESNVR